MLISFDRNILTESFEQVFLLEPDFEWGWGWDWVGGLGAGRGLRWAGLWGGGGLTSWVRGLWA